MTQLKTNSKKVREQIKNHLIERITAEGETIPEAVEKIEKEFNHFSNDYAVKRWPNREERFVSWCWGIPNVIDPLYTNYDILQFMESIGLPLPANKTEEEGADLYMRLLYRAFEEIKKEV